jgi:hypothetical protein
MAHKLGDNNIYLVALVGSILFFIIKFFEARIILKDKELNMKQLIRDTLLVYVSIIAGELIIGQLTYVTTGIDMLGGNNVLKNQAEIFTNEPPF